MRPQAPGATNDIAMLSLLYHAVEKNKSLYLKLYTFLLIKNWWVFSFFFSFSSSVEKKIVGEESKE